MLSIKQGKDTGLIISILGSLIATIIIAVSKRVRGWIIYPFHKYLKKKPTAELARFHKKHVEYIMRIYRVLVEASPFYGVVDVFEEHEIITQRIKTKREHFAIAAWYSEGESITALYIRQLLRYANQNDMRAMVITNASFSPEARKEIDAYNVKHPLRGLIVIEDDDKDELVEKLKPYFRKN